MQNIGGVACRRSEVANATVGCGLTNPQIVPGSQVGISLGAVLQWPLQRDSANRLSRGAN